MVHIRSSAIGIILTGYFAIPAYANNSPIDTFIWPDADMIGVVGDVIDSCNADSCIKHFVTPKWTTDLDQNYVILKFYGSDDKNFANDYEWVGGEEGDTVTTRKITRDAAYREIIKVHEKDHPENIVAEFYVWIIWATFGAPTINTHVNSSVMPTAPPTLRPATDRLFAEAIVEPNSMFQPTEEVPNLTGNRTQNVPASEYIARWPGLGQGIANGGAPHRWDVGQSMKRVYTNQPPKTIVRTDYNGSPLENFHLDNSSTLFPIGNTTINDFPADPLEANDDYSLGGLLPQSNNPYSGGEGGLDFHDSPAAPYIRESSGGVGETVHIKKTIHNFIRVQIGDSPEEGYKNWYIISENFTWYYNAKFINDGSATPAVMIDDGSYTSATDP
jgi:hypothetical protein